MKKSVFLPRFAYLKTWVGIISYLLDKIWFWSSFHSNLRKLFRSLGWMETHRQCSGKPSFSLQLLLVFLLRVWHGFFWRSGATDSRFTAFNSFFQTFGGLIFNSTSWLTLALSNLVASRSDLVQAKTSSKWTSFSDLTKTSSSELSTADTALFPFEAIAQIFWYLEVLRRLIKKNWSK